MALTMNNQFAEIQNTQNNIEAKKDWRQLKFSHPERTIRLATSFSGIGAIEQSLHRLGLKYQIQFAGDIDNKCHRHQKTIRQQITHLSLKYPLIMLQSMRFKPV